MALILLPLFMPLLLLGWIIEADEERALRDKEAEQEAEVGATWAVVFGRESELIERRALDWHAGQVHARDSRSSSQAA